MFSPPHQDRDNIYSQEPSTRLPREPAEGVKYLSKYEIFNKDSLYRITFALSRSIAFISDP